MNLKNKIVEIIYRLKDQFSKPSIDITSSIKDIGDASDSATDKIESNNKRAGSSFGGLVSKIGEVKIALVAVAVAAVAFVKTIGIFTDAASDREDVVNKLTSALIQQNDASKEQINVLLDQAAALQKLTGIDDERIIQSQAILANLGLTVSQIQLLTPTLLDMAESTRKTVDEQVNLDAAATTLVDTLIKGTDSLSKYGVELSVAEESAFDLANRNEQIAIIAEVLDGKFKGLAETFGKTYAGAVRESDSAQRDFIASIGELFIKNQAFIKLQTVIGDAWTRMADIIVGSAEIVGPVITGLSNTVIFVSNVFRVGFNAIQIAVKTSVAAILTPLILLNRALSAITFGDLSRNFEQSAEDIGKSVDALRKGIEEDFIDIGEAVGLVDDKLRKLPSAAEDSKDAAGTISDSADSITDSFDNAGDGVDRFSSKLKKSGADSIAVAQQIAQALDDIAVSANKPADELGATDITRGIDQVNNALETGDYESAQRRIQGVVDNIKALNEAGLANSFSGDQFLKAQLERLQELQGQVDGIRESVENSDQEAVNLDVNVNTNFDESVARQVGTSAGAIMQSAVQGYFDANPVNVSFTTSGIQEQLDQIFSDIALQGGSR